MSSGLGSPYRLERFGDTDGMLVPYFENDRGTNRMNMVRKAIIAVREHWERHGENTREEIEEQLLRMAVGRLVSKPHTRNGYEKVVRQAFARKRDWYERLPESEREMPPDMIKLYTHSQGYKAIFGSVHKIFRSENPPMEDVFGATYLVELLNIELYNYWCTHPEARNFTGTVYRGMSVTPETLDKFNQLVSRPVGKRAFSIPLALNSSSRRLEQAIRFCERTTKERPDLLPVLHKIHVHGLTAAQISAYRNLYPDSVVSSICAMHISEISAFPSEDEVLLRGPFFELLEIGVHRTLKCGGKPVVVVEMMMMNCNRDHFTTPQSGPADPARRLFGAIVRAGKFEACARRSADVGDIVDRDEYQRKADRANEDVARLLQEGV
jgi:hypothetical protein